MSRPSPTSTRVTDAIEAAMQRLATAATQFAATVAASPAPTAPERRETALAELSAAWRHLNYWRDPRRLDPGSGRPRGRPKGSGKNQQWEAAWKAYQDRPEPTAEEWMEHKRRVDAQVAAAKALLAQPEPIPGPIPEPPTMEPPTHESPAP